MSLLQAGKINFNVNSYIQGGFKYRNRIDHRGLFYVFSVIICILKMVALLPKCVFRVLEIFVALDKAE